MVFGVNSISVAATDASTRIDVVDEVNVTLLVLEVIAAEVVSSVFARTVIEVEADTAPESETVVPVEVTDTDPAVEVSGAVELETAAEPESKMLPWARIAPVGATEVPPLIVTVPVEAVNAPEPTKVVFGSIKIDPAEVVTAAF